MQFLRMGGGARRPACAAALCLISLLASPVSAQTEPESEPYYFYEGRDFGSESMIHPLRLIVNGGYGILQLDNRDNSPLEVDYRQGWKNTWRNILDPFGAIQHEGWGDFLQREIIPVSFNSGKAQYWPNYTNHLIGGGMSYRMMIEWFRWHEWEHPKLWAGATIFAYHMLNEVVENQDSQKWTTDPVADLLIFDPLSMWLFSSDRVSRFFSETLHMADWSYQPAYNFRSDTLENHGQNFALKWDLPKTERWRLFYHFGTHAELGITRRLNERNDLSVGAGLIAKNLIPDEGSFRTVELAESAGIWWDREGSLMASLEWADDKDYEWRLNLYPGLIYWKRIRPGFFAVLHHDDDVTLGMGVSLLPLGVALQL